MMPDFSSLGLPAAIAVFCATAAVIAIFGWRLSKIADRLADRTGLGEAVTGALLLGGATSISGIVTSVTAARGGYAELAVSNAIGGIAVQTAFLAIADLAYRGVNLEHAAASISSLMQGTLLIILLSILLVASQIPPFAVWNVSPATPLMFAVYAYGMRMISEARTRPMWRPRMTSETREDKPAAESVRERLAPLWIGFVVTAGIVGVSGWVVAQTGVAISRKTGLSETAVGALLTAVVTSLPELVTSVSAVRSGAETLAVSGIIGGNAFDTLFAAVSDIAYRNGSIYHAITRRQVFFISLTILMTGILLLGLLRREKRGIANIGLESFLILVLYFGAAVFLFMGG